MAKHGPAVTVIPVFMPINPSLLSNLLVFYQQTSLVLLPFLTVILNILHFTMVLNKSCFMHIPDILATSAAVDLPSWVGNPCGFPNLVLFSSNVFAFLFIYPTKAFSFAFWSLLLIRYEPIQYASSLAASFPLGSMSPYNIYSTVYSSPSANSAEVPPILYTSSETLII